MLRKVRVFRVNVMIFWENPLDQLVPDQGLAKDFPGELVGLGHLLDRLKVKEGKELLHQLRHLPEFPLGINSTNSLLIRHLSTTSLDPPLPLVK